MQLRLTFSMDSTALPINYRPLIHGMIYQALAYDPAFSAVLHSAASGGDDKRSFKGFTFSPLMGQYAIAEHTIFFHRQADLEIRSRDEGLIRLLHQSFSQKQTVRVGTEELTVTRCEMTDIHLQTNRIAIRMVSPVVAYRTDENGHTVFFSPDDEAFYSALVRNAQRKCQHFGLAQPFDLQISSLNKKLPGKQFSMFKKTYITGWFGSYLLEGDPGIIDLLYQAGLGAKNSEGFGLFIPETNKGHSF